MSDEARTWLPKGSRSIAYRSPPTGRHRAALLENMAILHGYYSAVGFSDCEVELGVSGCSQFAGEQMQLSLVLHNGAEFGHMTRPTGVVTQCSKIVCSSMSSGNAVFTPPAQTGLCVGPCWVWTGLDTVY